MESFSLLRLLSIVTIIAHCCPSVVNETTFSFEESLQISSERIVEDLIQRYAESKHEEFFESFSGGTGEESRELVHIESIAEKSVPGRYLQWRQERVGLQNYVFGLQMTSLDVFGSDLEKKTSIELSEPAIALASFTRWDDEKTHPEIILVVTTSKPSLALYRFENDAIKQINGDWPLHAQMRSIEATYVDHAIQVVLIPETSSEPVDIYNVDINGDNAQVWFHQRLETHNSTMLVYQAGHDSLIAAAHDKIVQIFRFDINAGKFIDFRSFSTKSKSSNLVAFTLNYHQILASVPQPGSSMEFFRFDGSEFHEVSLGSLKVTDVRAIALDSLRDEQILIGRGETGELTFLSYERTGNSEQFAQRVSCSLDPCSFHGVLSNGVSFIANGLAVYLMPTEANGSSARVLSISATIQETSSPVYQQSLNLLQEFSDLSGKFLRWEKVVFSTQDILSDALSLTQSNIVDGEWSVREISATQVAVQAARKLLHDATLSTNGSRTFPDFRFMDFTFVDSRWEEHDFQINHSETAIKTRHLQNRADEILAVLGDTVPLNSEDVHIIKAKQVVSSSMSCKTLETTNIQVKSINRLIDLSDFFKSIVSKSSSISAGSVAFQSELSVDKLQTGSLFGIPVENIALLSAENNFKCPIQFQSPLSVLGSVQCSTVNKLNFKDEVIDISDINGVTFVDGLVASREAQVSGPVDSVTITHAVFDSLFLKATSQKVIGSFDLTDIVVQAARVRELNGEGFVEKTSRIVSPSFSGTIFGRKTFVNEVKCSAAFIDKTLNGIAFPDGFIFANQKKIVLSGSKVFDALNAAKVSVTGPIQGLNTNHMVSKDDYASLKNALTFAGPVKFTGKVALRKTINGVSTDQLRHQDTLDTQRLTYAPDADIEFLQPVTFRNLIAESVNGQTFEELFGNILFFDGTSSIHINVPTKFRKSLNMKSLTVNTSQVNQLNLNNFFTLSSPQTINGNLILQAPVKFSSLHALSKFDSINLAELFQDAFLLSKARVIPSDFSFEHVSCGSTMKVQKEINNYGEDFSSAVAVVSGRDQQTFAIPTTFDAVNIETCHINELNQEAGKTLGGLDVQSWFSRYVRLSENIKMPHTVAVHGLVKALEGIDARKLNGFTIPHLKSGVLRNDVHGQTFQENFKTSGMIKIKNGAVEFMKGVSGFDLEEIFANAVPLNGNSGEVIRSAWKFEKLVVNQELQVDGLIGEVNLGLLDADIVRKGESFITIHGKKTFVTDFTVHHTMSTKSINFEDLFANVFTLHTPQVITGSVQFAEDQIIKETLNTQRINSISLDELASIYSFDKETSTHVLKYDVESEGLLSSEKLTVEQLIQNKRFLDFTQHNIIRTTQTELKIIGSKTFKNVVNINGAIDADTLNEYALSHEKRIARKTDKHLNFKHAVTFLREVEAPKITVQHGNAVFETLANIEFDKLITDALRSSSKDILDSGSFESIVSLADVDKVQTLNDILISNIATTHSGQNLGHLNVKSVILEGENVVIQGDVIGHDLRKAFENTLVSHSIKEQVNQGALDFLGNVIVKGNFRCLGTAADDIVTTSSEREIHSRVEFVHRIHVKHLQAKNLVNGHRFEDIVTHAVTDGATEDITAFWKFEKGVTFQSNVEGEGHVSGYHLPTLVEKKKTEVVETVQVVEAAQTKFEAKCTALNLLSTVLATSPCRLHSIDNHQSIITRKTVEKIVTLRNPTTLLLLALDQSGDVSTYRWNTNTEQFIAHDQAIRLRGVQVLRSISFGTASILAYISEAPGFASHGLNVLVFNENELSPSELLATGSFNDIQLITEENSGSTDVALCAIDSDDKLFIFEWDHTEKKFIEVVQTQLKGPVKRIAVAKSSEGIAILHHCDTSLHLSHYSWSDKSVTSVHETSFLANADSAFSLIEDEGNLFGLIEGKESLAQPACNLQVFQLDQNVNIIQKLRANNANSMTSFKFCGTNYVASFSKSVGVTVFKFQGISGFSVFNENPIKIAHGRDMTVFTEFIKDYGSNVPFIVVSTSKSIEVFHSNVIGHQFSSRQQNHCRS